MIMKGTTKRNNDSRACQRLIMLVAAAPHPVMSCVVLVNTSQHRPPVFNVCSKVLRSHHAVLTMSDFSVDNAFAHRHCKNKYRHSTDTERTQNVDTCLCTGAGQTPEAQPGAQVWTQPRAQLPNPPWGKCMGLFFASIRTL